MTNKQVAFIRGINVGSAKRVAMADLRALVEDLGHEDVRTILNSGNIVFSTPHAAPGDGAAQIEKAIETRLGISARVTVLSAKELNAAVANNPLLDVATNHSRLMMAVVRNRADLGKLKPLTKEDWSPEALAVGVRVAYFWCPEGILESRLAQAVARALGDGVTSRNWATVLKLHALTRD